MSENHLITISNIGCSLNHINVFDSIPHRHISSRAKEQICALMFSDARKLTQFQKGGSDCDLFSIAFAASLCTGFDPADLQYYQTLFHNHPLKYLTPFPAYLKNQKSNHQQKISLYCLCRQPKGARKYGTM